MEGGFTLQNIFQMYEVNRSIENPLRHFPAILSKTFNNIKLNKPLYYFTLPGFILVAGGVYMCLNFVQTSHLDGSFDFKFTALIIMLTLVGISMVFIGILLHSITGLMRYKANNP